MSPFVSIAIELLANEDLSLKTDVALGELVAADARLSLAIIELKTTGKLDEPLIMQALGVCEEVLASVCTARDSYVRELSQPSRRELVASLGTAAKRLHTLTRSLVAQTSSRSSSDVE